MTPHPRKAFTRKLTLNDEAAVRRIRRASINCTSVLKIRPGDQLQRALDADRIWEIDTGHDLMITEPRALAEMLLQIP
jgi:hypothetical protein